jgi:hypothetical protein
MDILSVAVSALRRHHHYTEFNPAAFSTADIFFVIYPEGIVRISTNTSLN